ncbi:MAG: coagulation factor 5/8 type-like protein [Propionibacteriales bacterium]|nr:coagulation factor 5/8 type-like protein [Propionibacteriales bacterium]
MTAIPATFGVQSPNAISGKGGAGDPAATHDVRRAADAVVRPTRDQLDAVRDLVRRAPQGTRVTYDERFGTPRTIYPARGTLTGAQQGKPADIARGWLSDHRAALGLTAADVAALAVTGDHVLGTGTHIVNFAQTFGDVETVHGGSMSVAVRRDGSVESYAGQTVRHTTLAGGWDISARAALEKVVGALAGGAGFTADAIGSQAGYTKFAKGGFAGSSYAKRAVFVTSDGARPAYQVLFIKKQDAAWDVVVDARSGDVLFRDSLVDHAEPEGTVYENFPGAPAGGAPVVKSFGPTDESPSGYVDPTGLAGLPGPTTIGNNASSYANWSNFLVPADQAPRPLAPDAHFNYVFENAWEESECTAVPPSYADDIDPAATSLFYHHNRVHDEFYSFGFTESAGNFQVNNGGQGGESGDPILGLVQAGAVTGGAPLYTGRDNAYMLTLPDGLPAWSGMFLWEPIEDAFEGPCRDGDFDASVIEHEYAHGLSNRYVSAEDGALGTHQSGSMGEGWGDWYALNYLHREGLSDKSVVGEYVTGNADRGIRNWDYDTNPTTFGDIGYDLTGPEVHADGEIWTATLWDYRQALVERFGQARAAEIAQLTVTDAMPRSPVDPSFVDMRDAIALAIDDRYHDSADYETIVDLFWTEFAKRGLGFHAASDGGDDLDPTPAFDHPETADNGTLAGRVVNASTGRTVAEAKVVLGEFEGRVSPLRTTGTTGGFSAPVVEGTYPVTVQARGFGSQTFEGVRVNAGETTRLRFEISPNLTSLANGAEIVSATSGNARALFDDTEASTWTNDLRGNVVVELAKAAEVSAVQVSAYTTSRFQALKDFTLQVSTNGVTWRNALVEKDAFGYQRPRPVAPDVHYKTFELATPVEATFVRFYTDAPMGETLDQVQAAELQVFSGKVRGVEPLPPEPPDEPITDQGVIAFSTPGGDATDGGLTGVAFQNTCTFPPATQGSDGWVTELPDSFGDGLHEARVVGEGPAPHDFDLYFYSADCEVTGSSASAAANESGTIPSGTKYVLTHLWLGAAEPFTLTATDTQ